MTIPSWAVRGAKVVCINGGDPTCIGFDIVGQYPVTKGLYTVRGCWFDPVVDRAILLLEEFKTDLIIRGGECGWDAARFLPVVSKTAEHDLATHFEQYLKTDHRATRRVGEDA